jgi:cysteinyl-tRNA synthetase
VRATNTALDENAVKEENRWEAARVLEIFDKVFDVLNPSSSPVLISASEIEAKIEERKEAKRARDFARADEIRGFLLERGVIIEDTKDGVRWKRK